MQHENNGTGGASQPNADFVSPDGYDLCVRCKAKTRYKKEKPHDERQDYVPGAGQCCPACYSAVYEQDQLHHLPDY